MTTMIEKMARAMWGWEMQTQMFRTFDNESEDTRRTFMARARAALTAMLEPNEAMLSAAFDVLEDRKLGEDYNAKDVLNAAIQAALDEPTTPPS